MIIAIIVVFGIAHRLNFLIRERFEVYSRIYSDQAARWIINNYLKYNQINTIK